jgi:2-polyprenyl-3-methyl-5-hydroxy-6-metoxy-1,4-benzoquinol methylase
MHRSGFDLMTYAQTLVTRLLTRAANERNPYSRRIKRILDRQVDYSTYANPVAVRKCDALFEERWITNRAAYRTDHWANHFEIDNLIRAGVLGDSPTLDFGCGTGNIDIELAKRGYRMIGVDLSPKAIEIANLYRADLPEDVKERAVFHQADITTFDRDEPLAACIMLHVVEHIQDPAIVFTALRRLLAQNGVMWVSVPFGDHYEDPGHVHHFYTKQELADFLGQYARVENIIHDETNNVLCAILHIRSGD